MADGFVRLYRRDWTPEQVRRRVDSLAATGMVLAYPGTGRITAIDEIGEQVEMFRDELIAAMAGLGDKSFTFQYWLEDDQDADVVCTLRPVGDDVVVETYYLDGFGGPVYRKGQDTVIRRLLAEFRATGESAVGLIVDRWGESAADELDDIVLGRPAPITVVPELYVLQPDIALRHWDRSELVPYGDFLAHDTDDILALG
jgi:hypothetical protein